MDEKHLISVEKWTLTFAAVAVLVSWLVFGGLRGKMAFGVTMGAVVMCLNAFSLRRIGQRAFAKSKKPGATLLLFNLKMLLLLGLIFLVIHYLPVDPVGFIVGISIFPAAVLATALRHGLGTSADDQDHKGETHG